MKALTLVSALAKANREIMALTAIYDFHHVASPAWRDAFNRRARLTEKLQSRLSVILADQKSSPSSVCEICNTAPCRCFPTWEMRPRIQR